jgi:hypothetical protein
MRDGLYRIMFQTQFGRGSGVMHLHGGRMWGGDSSMFYVGTYTEEKAGVTASVTVGRHTKKPMSRSVFGVDQVSITISVKPVEVGAADDTYNFTGTAAEAPRVSLSGMLQRVSD